MTNIFLNPKPTPRDAYVYGSLIILFVIFIVGYLQSSSLQNFGLIYALLSILILIMMSVAMLSKFKIGAWVIYGKGFTTKAIIINVIIGFAVAFLILAFSHTSGLSISVPLSIVSSAITSNNYLNYLVVSFYSPLIEEIFWIGVLCTSLILFSKSKSRDFDVVTFSIVLGFFVLFFGVEYLQTAGIILAILIFLFAFIIKDKPFVKVLGKTAGYTGTLIGSIITADLFLVLLHVYAYGSLTSNIPLFVGAGIFFFLEGIIDVYRQSIVPSIIMHTLNNAVIAVSLLNIIPTVLFLPTWFWSVVLMALFLLTLGVGYNSKITPIKFIKSESR